MSDIMICCGSDMEGYRSKNYEPHEWAGGIMSAERSAIAIVQISL